MKKSTLTLASWVIATLLFTFTSCSKYEEGPGFSLRTKKQRVVAEWKATSFTINGQNGLNSSTAGVLDCFSGNQFSYNITGTMDIKWTFEKDGKSTVVVNSDYNTLDFENSMLNCTAIYVDDTYDSTENTTWDFSSDKKNIEITYDDGSKETWEIIELREKEMKLKMTDSDNDNYQITLEKI